MKDKNVKAIFPIITIILIIFIGILVTKILSDENKEVKVAKDFIQDLAKKDIIDYYDKDDDKDQNNALNKLINQNSQIQYSVLLGNYGVDIDKEYNVIGFSNKNIRKPINELKVANYTLSDEEVLNEAKAIDYATKYIKEISEEEFVFKEVKNKEGEENPYYAIVFYKCKDGYPIYKQEITTLIDKNSWKLQGYSNYPLGDKEYINEMNIDEESAVKIVLGSFKEINLIKEDKNTVDIDKVDIAYVEIEENKLVLSYIINIKESTGENYSVIISGDNGEIISTNLEMMKKK